MAQSRKPPAKITARVTIEGAAEEVLAALQRVRGGKRSVGLAVEVSKKDFWAPDHHLPEIKDGEILNALRKLADLSQQTLIDDDTETRLEQLIREFGELTT